MSLIKTRSNSRRQSNYVPDGGQAAAQRVRDYIRHAKWLHEFVKSDRANPKYELMHFHHEMNGAIVTLRYGNAYARKFTGRIYVYQGYFIVIGIRGKRRQISHSYAMIDDVQMHKLESGNARINIYVKESDDS